MLRRYNRLLVALYVLADTLAAAAAFLLAYLIRFDSWFMQLVPVTKDQPSLQQYLISLPAIALLVPLAFHRPQLFLAVALLLREARTALHRLLAIDHLLAALLGDLRGLLGSGFTSGFGLGLLCSHFRLPPRHSGSWRECQQPEGMLHDVYCHLV